MKFTKEGRKLEELQLWNLDCISKTLLENNVDYSGTIEALYDRIPYGAIRHSIETGNATIVCQWAMEYFGYEETQDGWIKK